jgi:hypothetical protein
MAVYRAILAFRCDGRKTLTRTLQSPRTQQENDKPSVDVRCARSYLSVGLTRRTRKVRCRGAWAARINVTSRKLSIGFPSVFHWRIFFYLSPFANYSAIFDLQLATGACFLPLGGMPGYFCENCLFSCGQSISAANDL